MNQQNPQDNQNSFNLGGDLSSQNNQSQGGGMPTPPTPPTGGQGGGIPTPPTPPAGGQGGGIPTPPTPPTGGQGGGIPTPPTPPTGGQGGGMPTPPTPPTGGQGGGMPTPPTPPTGGQGGGIPTPPTPPTGGQGGGIPTPPTGYMPPTSVVPPAGAVPTPGAQQAAEPEDTTPANFQLGTKLPAKLGVKVPPHSLKFDEEYFVRLLAGSISLTKDEKKKIVESVPKLRQAQVDELIRIFEEEKRKFAALSQKHVPQLEKLARQHYEDWMDLEKEVEAQSAKEQEQAKADEIRKNLGL